MSLAAGFTKRISERNNKFLRLKLTFYRQTRFFLPNRDTGSPHSLHFTARSSSSQCKLCPQHLLFLPKHSPTETCMFETRADQSGTRKPDAGSGFIPTSELLDEFRPFLQSQAESMTKGQIGRRFSRSDIVQETLLTAHQSLHQFRGNSKPEFAAWLKRILMNKFCSWLQRHTAKVRDLRREKQLDSFECQPTQEFGVRQKTPSKVMQLQEESDVVGELIEQLPEHYRRVLDLRHNHDYSFREIAIEFNKTEGAVRLLWLRAITRLRSLYSQQIQ